MLVVRFGGWLQRLRIGGMLVWACIAPHGGEVIPELATADPARMATTRQAMEELGRRCACVRPETIVVFTPHGICLDGRITISVADLAAGYLDGENGVRIAMRMDVDNELSEAIAEECVPRGVPVAELGYRDGGARLAVFPLDWGVLVPMYFLGVQWPDAPRVVVACPDSSVGRSALTGFGEAVGSAARRIGRRVGVVCSADQGHGHSEDGPYGFARQSAPHDAAYCRAVADNALDRLLRWRNDRIEAAMTDSYRQTLMLYGALASASLKPELLSYEAPTYFGMACASFDPC
ncbi:MAG: aromatic ring-opening dioxygenase subunit LigB [Armatimonadetes bacterium]|nr:aromatic ring-opening dioxygenase subunit LigB [Armatimonadota bacterium]